MSRLRCPPRDDDRCERLNSAYSDPRRGYQHRGERCAQPWHELAGDQRVCRTHAKYLRREPQGGALHRLTDEDRADIRRLFRHFRAVLGLGPDDPYRPSAAERVACGVLSYSDAARIAGVSPSTIAAIASGGDRRALPMPGTKRPQRPRQRRKAA